MWEDNIKINLRELIWPCVNSVGQLKTSSSSLSLILAVLNILFGGGGFGRVVFICRQLVIRKFIVNELHNYSNCKPEVLNSSISSNCLLGFSELNHPNFRNWNDSTVGNFYSDYCYLRCVSVKILCISIGPGSSVGIATELPGWTVWDRIPVDTRFSARPDRPWGPPSLL